MPKKHTSATPKKSAQPIVWWRRRAVRIGIIVAAVLAGLFVVGYGVALTSLPIKATYQTSDQQVTEPLIITLNQKLRTIPTDAITITPTTSGRWEAVQRGILGTTQLKFTPERDFRTATTYTVTLPDSPRIFFGTAKTDDIIFTTEKAPSLNAKAGSAAINDGETIAADYQPSITLQSKNRQLRKLELRTTPQVDATLSSRDDQSFSWKFSQLLPQGESISLEVYDTKNNESLLKKSFAIAPKPTIATPVKQTYFTDTDTATITFSEPIDPESKQFIEFSLAGTGDWQSDTVYQFKPEKVDPGATYAYTIKAGLRSKRGGITTEDDARNFTTTGAVAVSGMSPWGQSLKQSAQTLKFTFDQPVDHASAESLVSVSSGTITGRSWQGNTLLVTVKDLGFQQTVTGTISAGVKNASFGLPSAHAYSVNFTTEARTVRLSVPHFRQQHAATCTAASLRMILAYRGIGSDEMGLVNAMGYAPRNMDKSQNPPVWDDPSQMFVGSIDGTIGAGTGAGTDAPPVAKAARTYGRGASAVTGIGPGWIAQQIHNGNPVIMFGATKASTGYARWTTPSGKAIVSNYSGHATVVTGVVGEPHAPIGFYVNDPLGGASYWSAGAVAANIARDPDRQAVVVY